MIFKSDAQRRAMFASLGNISFSRHPECDNSFAVAYDIRKQKFNTQKNISRLMRMFLPKFADDFDPQSYDFEAHYDANATFEENVNSIEKDLINLQAFKPIEFGGSTKEKRIIADSLVDKVLTERDNIDIDDLFYKMGNDRTVKNLFRDKLTSLVLMGALSPNDYFIQQYEDVDETFHKKMNQVQKINELVLNSFLVQQQKELAAKNAALEATTPEISEGNIDIRQMHINIKDDSKEQNLSNVIDDAVKKMNAPVRVERFESKSLLPNPEEKDYLPKLVKAVIKPEANKTVGFADNELDYIEWSDQV